MQGGARELFTNGRDFFAELGAPTMARSGDTPPHPMAELGGRARDVAGVGTRQASLKCCLSILSALIFDSSVDDGTPSRRAAPNGPATRPLLSESAASMASFSRFASVLVGEVAATVGGVWPRRPESHRSSIESVSESEMITARSMTFCSSRMFPGQSYDCSKSAIALLMPRILLPARLVYRWMKYSTSRGISARRSRNAGTCRGNTLSR